MSIPNLKKVFNKKFPVYYKLINRGSDETIVFLHGLFSTSSIFRSFTDKVTQNVLLVELRGIVYSKCKAPFLQNYVEDVRLILQKEQIQGNLIFVGYSLGCSIANHFADKFSEMVNKVVMLAPINRTFTEIGPRKFASDMVKALGKDFFHKWHEYREVNMLKARDVLRPFNLRLLKDVYQNINFTSKSPVVILSGRLDNFFNQEDHMLNLPNIVHEQIENLDHFFFMTKDRIALVSARLLPMLARKS